MAHQAHNIPWNSIASKLKYIHQYNNARGEGSLIDPTNRRTDLYPIEGQDQDKSYVYFVSAFIKILNEFIDSERRKYPSGQELQPFNDDEDIFSQEGITSFRRSSLENEARKCCRRFGNRPIRS
jgi:hypothetical protein